MIRKATRQRKQRRRIFLGCEGDSERSYGALLQHLIDQRAQDVHVDRVLLGGGDPLTLVTRATQAIEQKSARFGESYELHALLLDSDRRGQNKKKDQEALKLATEWKLRLIWQDPCHEAFLLRHLKGCDHLRPRTVSEAHEKLLKRWPHYWKGIPYVRLKAVIDYDAVNRAASVEPELFEFLNDIRF